jgi:hypothetical protein
MSWPYLHLVKLGEVPVAMMDAGDLEPEDAMRWQLRGRVDPISDSEFDSLLARHSLVVADARDPAYRKIQKWSASRSSIESGKSKAISAWAHESAAHYGWEPVPGMEWTTLRMPDSWTSTLGQGALVVVSIHTAMDYPNRLSLRVMSKDHLELRWSIEGMAKLIPDMTCVLATKYENYWQVRLPPTELNRLLDALSQGTRGVVVVIKHQESYLARTGAAIESLDDGDWEVLPDDEADTLSDGDVAACWVDNGLWDHRDQDAVPSVRQHAGAASPEVIARHRQGSALFALVLHRLTGWRVVMRANEHGNEVYAARDLHGRVWTPDNAGSYPLFDVSPHDAWQDVASWRLPLKDEHFDDVERRRRLASEIVEMFGPWFTLVNIFASRRSATEKQVVYAKALSRSSDAALPPCSDLVTYSAFITAHAPVNVQYRHSQANDAVDEVILGSPPTIIAEPVQLIERSPALRPPNHGMPWTKDAKNLVRSLWKAGTGVDVIAKTLGRGDDAVATRIMALGLMTDEGQGIRQGITTQQINTFKLYQKTS